MPELSPERSNEQNSTRLAPDLIIDSHAHVFPDPLGKVAPRIAQEPLAELRRRARGLLRPVSASLHKAQTFLRLLPEGARRKVDELNAIAPLPSFLVESTLADLREAMDENGVSRTLVIAHPPLVSNEFILEACQQEPRLHAGVYIPKSSPQPAALLQKFVKQGAKALKIHPAADGEGTQSERYRTLIAAASEEGIPIIVHTGCIHTHLFYRDPEQSRAENFREWFETFHDARFVLAHMNFHEPDVAFDLAEEYGNVWLDTSWQPTEVIGEAVRRVGSKRVMFGTDWPFAGANTVVGLDRIHVAVECGFITEEQSRQILGETAAKLFGIGSD